MVIKRIINYLSPKRRTYEFNYGRGIVSSIFFTIMVLLIGNYLIGDFFKYWDLGNTLLFSLIPILSFLAFGLEIYWKEGE